MKKVAIVTPDALSSRSFIWDTLTQTFKAKISATGGNKVTQLEDGLYVGGDGPVEVGIGNKPGLVEFKDNVVNLPHFSIEVMYMDGYRSTITINSSVDVIPRLDVRNNGSIGGAFTYFDITGSTTRILDVRNSYRLIYVYKNTLYVMDIFLAVEEVTVHGFVDVVICADLGAFPTVQTPA